MTSFLLIWSWHKYVCMTNCGTHGLTSGMSVYVCVTCLFSMTWINDTAFSCLYHWMISPFTDTVRPIYCLHPNAWSMSTDLVSHREAKWGVCVCNRDSLRHRQKTWRSDERGKVLKPNKRLGEDPVDCLLLPKNWTQSGIKSVKHNSEVTLINLNFMIWFIGSSDMTWTHFGEQQHWLLMPYSC